MFTMKRHKISRAQRTCAMFVLVGDYFILSHIAIGHAIDSDTHTHTPTHTSAPNRSEWINSRQKEILKRRTMLSISLHFMSVSTAKWLVPWMYARTFCSKKTAKIQPTYTRLGTAATTTAAQSKQTTLEKEEEEQQQKKKHTNQKDRDTLHT